VDSRTKYWIGWITVIVFYLLRHDFWNWDKIEPLLFGWMPVGLWYHLLYVVLSAGVIYIFTKCCWPETPAELLKNEETLFRTAEKVAAAGAGVLRGGGIQTPHLSLQLSRACRKRSAALGCSPGKNRS
jgi:hypothetical protein